MGEENNSNMNINTVYIRMGEISMGENVGLCLYNFGSKVGKQKENDKALPANAVSSKHLLVVKHNK